MAESQLSINDTQPRPQCADFRIIVSRFVHEIDSLAETLPLAMMSIVAATKSAKGELSRFTRENTDRRDGPIGLVKIRVNDFLRFERLRRRATRASEASRLVPRSVFVALISQYDGFLGDLIEACFFARPEILNGSDKTLTLSDLLSFGSIAAAREHFIEKEVESVLRKSHVEHFEWLETKFKINLRKDLAIWPRFVEVTERRNLFVHTAGQVSAQYLKNCKHHKVDCSDVKHGDSLEVTPAYFRAAHEAIFEIGVKLAHVLWRKLKPEERETADIELISVTYDLLKEEKFNLAKALLDFATEVLKDFSNERLRMQLVVNRIQAYKWSNDSQRALELLSREDFSALREEFRLAEAVLRDDYENAITIVADIGAAGAVKLGHYREWPLFRELRKRVEFEATILEVFGEPLNKVSIEEPG